MLTIFTHCKAFQGHIAIIQRNAISSWLHLRPACEVILCGNRDGTADTAKEFGLRHIPDIAVNEYGTPFVNDLFEKAQRLARYDLVCYANCDIIFMSDFMHAVERLLQQKRRFLVVGECWNLDLAEPLDHARADWEDQLRHQVSSRGIPRGPRSIDFFLFPRGLYGTLPPFVLGTGYFDNWLIWRARNLRAAVIDVTQAAVPVHQNHDYSHIPGGYRFTRQGENAIHNLRLAGGMRHIYWMFDSSHYLTPTGLRRNFGGYFRLRYLWHCKRFWRIVEFTRPLRHAIGLRLGNLGRLRGFLVRHRIIPKEL